MLQLPNLVSKEASSKSETVAFLGLNFSDNLQDGQLTDCENLTSERYPYLSSRKRRSTVEGFNSPTAITAWGKLIVVDGTDIYYDGQVKGQVSAGEKQFAVVNTKLVIWPDKKYLDMDTLTVKDLGASITTGAAKAVFTDSKITISSLGTDLTTVFNAGDGLTITGCTTQSGNNKDFIVKSVTSTEITTTDNAFTACTEAAEITIERKIPDLDYICESENRLWGCSSTKRTIYASSLGDPTNFFVYEGLSTDAYALAVGSEGDFTGCCKLSSAVLFWKEGCLHKLLGSYPAEYSMTTYSIDGLLPGCSKSLQVINEVLFYMGTHGVYAYSGGSPTLLTDGFERRGFTDGVAGTDGSRYYLSVREGEKKHLLCYDTRRNLWLREDDTLAVDFARIGKDLYLLTDEGQVMKMDDDAGSEDVRWYAELAPFYEVTNSSKKRSSNPSTRQVYSRLFLRVEIDKGAYLRAEVRCDDGAWQKAGNIVGSEKNTDTLLIAPVRCDKFQVRLSGKGRCAVLSMLREVRTVSEVR